MIGCICMGTLEIVASVGITLYGAGGYYAARFINRRRARKYGLKD